jgi:hypothetical protein
MTPENQGKVRKFCVTSTSQMVSFLATYTAGSTVEEFARFILFVGLAILLEAFRSPPPIISCINV